MTVTLSALRRSGAQQTRRGLAHTWRTRAAGTAASEGAPASCPAVGTVTATASRFTPYGIIVVDGHTYRAVTDGHHLEPGTPAIVTASSSVHVEVEPYSEPVM